MLPPAIRHDLPFFNYQLELPEVLDVGQRILGDDDQVSKFAWLNRAEFWTDAA